MGAITPGSAIIATALACSRVVVVGRDNDDDDDEVSNSATFQTRRRFEHDVSNAMRTRVSGGLPRRPHLPHVHVCSVEGQCMVYHGAPYTPGCMQNDLVVITQCPARRRHLLAPSQTQNRALHRPQQQQPTHERPSAVPWPRAACFVSSILHERNGPSVLLSTLPTLTALPFPFLFFNTVHDL